MGFVAWLRPDPPPPDDEEAAESRSDATELEHHLQIVRSSRLATVTVVREADDEPDRPVAA